MAYQCYWCGHAHRREDGEQLVDVMTCPGCYPDRDVCVPRSVVEDCRTLAKMVRGGVTDGRAVRLIADEILAALREVDRG